MNYQILDDEAVVEEVPTNAVAITNETKSVIICVYGTLRAGEGNHRRMGNSKLLGTFKSEPNYTMYGRRSGFPILTEGKTSITYEAYEVTNQKTLEGIHSLEGCTGIPGDPLNWYDIVPIETPVGKGWIYLQHDKDYGADRVIANGDWKSKSL